MKVFIVFLTKWIIIWVNWLGKLKPGYKFDALVIGNYEHMSSYHKLLVDKLNSENISNHFLYNVEKDNYLFKLFAYARCAYVIAKAKNILVFDYCFPLYCVRKLPGQKMYQLWHANGSFKRFGLPNFREKYGVKMAESLYSVAPIHSTYDYIFVSNEKCIPHYMKAFNDFNKEKFIVSNTILLDSLIEISQKNNYVKKPDEITIVLAPTYNYHPERDIYVQFSEFIKNEAQNRGMTANVITLLHPKLAPNFDKNKIIMNADILITDYSSVCFEASAIGKKVAFLRSKEKLEVFIEVAKKIYYSPNELAIDILEDRIVENRLNDYLCFNGNKQLDMVLSLIKSNSISSSVSTPVTPNKDIHLNS